MRNGEGIVQYVLAERDLPPLPVESYQPRDDLTGWRKLVMRLAFWAVAKLGCYRQEEVVKTEVYRIKNGHDDGVSLMRNLQISYQNLIRYTGRDQGTLLLGPDTFMKLQHQSGPDGPLHWAAYRQDIPLGQSRPGGEPEYRLYGLDVHVVPWMEGSLMLPGRIDADARYHA